MLLIVIARHVESDYSFCMDSVGSTWYDNNSFNLNSLNN